MKCKTKKDYKRDYKEFMIKLILKLKGINE